MWRTDIVPDALVVFAADLENPSEVAVPDTEEAETTPGELSSSTRDYLALLDDPSIDQGLCPPTDDTRVAMSHVPAGPVLVLNQAFDVLAPQSAAENLGANWPEAEVVVLETGDAPSVASPCVRQLISEFLSGKSPTIGDNCS